MTDLLDSALRTRLQRAIAPSVPTPGASQRVLRRLRTTMESGTSAGWRPSRAFAVALVSTAVIALLGGAVGAVFALRHAQPSHPPLPAPAVAHTPAVTPTPAATPTPSSGPSPCDGASLSARTTFTIGAAGHDGFDVQLHNQGAVACTLTGYAALSGEQGSQPVTLNVQHEASGMVINPTGPGGTVPVRTIVLAPGGDAYFSVEYVTVNSDPRPCARLTHLLVTPPGAATQLVLNAMPSLGAVCAVGGGDPWMNETPVAAAPYLPYP